MESLTDQYWRAPPMARTFATLTFTLSAGCFLGFLPMYWFIYHPSLLMQFPPQIWRLATTYMMTTPGLGLLFDTYFSYMYMSQLESGHARFPRKEDLLWYLIFIAGAVVGLSHLSGWVFSMYLQALVLAMCYTVTQDQRGMTASFYFINIPAQLTPYAMIAVTFLMAGPGGAILQLHGLVAAHLYDFLTRLWPEFGGGSNLLPTPSFLSRLVDTPRVLQREYGTAIRSSGAAGGGQTSGRSTGASTGPLPDSWRTRGQGHRLG